MKGILRAALAVAALTAGLSVAQGSVPPATTMAPRRRRRPPPPGALQAEIYAHNEEVERVKAEKKMAKLARRANKR